MIEFKKILVLAPHTDDAELGCGGTISRLIDELNSEVRVVHFSNAVKSLPNGFNERTLLEESHESLTFLGVKSEEIFYYNFETREFDKDRQSILDVMLEHKRLFSPDLVLLPCSRDIHQDHAVIYNEGIRAFKECSVFGYQLEWNLKYVNQSFSIILNQESIEKKVTALSHYRSQEKRYYMSEEYLLSKARLFRSSNRLEFAEFFEIYNCFI